MPTVLLHAFPDLLFLCASSVVATGIGALALRVAGVSCTTTGERGFFAFAAGLGATGYAVFLPGALGLLIPGVLRTILLVLLPASGAGWLLLCRAEAAERGRPRPAPGGLPENGAAALLAGFLALALALALAPETGKDALIYHLTVPKRYLEAGGFLTLPGNIFADSPLHGEMLYLAALFLRGEVSAKLLHFGALLGVLAGMRCFSLRHVPGNAFPNASMLLFAGIPTVFAVSHTAYTDLFVVLYALAAFFAFSNWSEDGTAGWLGLAGFFTGLALSCKYTALPLPLFGLLGILWVSRRRDDAAPKALRSIATYAVPLAFSGSPFYLKNLFLTGNPFYPFLYGIFGGGNWSPEQAQLYDAFVAHLGMGRGWLDYLLLPWNVSVRAEMNSPRFDGILGPVFLLTLPFLAGARRIGAPFKAAMVFCLLWFLFWASSAQQMRYLMPVFPFLAVGAGLALSRSRSLPGRWIPGALAAVVAGGVAFNGYHAARDFAKHRPLGVIAGTESRSDYLARVVPSYGMYRYAGLHLPKGSRVFLIYMRNYTWLCETECYSDSMFESYTIQKILSASGSPGDVLDALRSRGITHLMYDERYVFGGLSLFRGEEKALFSRFQSESLDLLHMEGPFRLYRVAGSRGS